MQKILLTLTLFTCLSSCGQSNSKSPPKAVEMDCGPDATVECSFLNMPGDVGSIMEIPANSGTPMIITGTIYKADGVTPYPGVALYAYHTDDKGKYSKSGNETSVQKWHGRHHGWCKTDSKGKYEIHSIRPARYPDNTMPAHIHSTIMEPGGKKYWINDFVFKDDSLVNKEYISSLIGAGDNGIVDLKLSDGKWIGIRDIILTK